MSHVFNFKCILLLPALWLCWNLGHGQVPRSSTLIYVEGKNVTPRAHFELERDDLVRFDAYGLEPGSALLLEARKGGVKFYTESFPSNDRGEVKAILFFPKAGMSIACKATYKGKNGREKSVRFFLEPAGSSRPKRRRSKTGINPSVDG